MFLGMERMYAVQEAAFNHSLAVATKNSSLHLISGYISFHKESGLGLCCKGMTFQANLFWLLSHLFPQTANML